jgi:Brp/Blh family beta-carotene 15,15'-monooxygenase
MWVEWSPLPVVQSGQHALLGRYSLRLMALSLLLFVPLAGLGFKSAEWPMYLQLLPLFISLFLFGMPHGGADHLLLWGMLRKDSWSRRMVTLSLYTLIALAYLTFWDFNPPAAALFFLGLTIFHWGQGDRYISIQVHQATYISRSKVLSALHILSRGSIPILLPGYMGNDTYRNVIEALVSSGGQASYQAVWVSSYPLVFLLIPLGLTIASLIAAAISMSKKEIRPLCIDSIESVALFGWFLFVPALWAIGCYFALWHSLRHALRILSTDSTGSQLLDSKQYLKLNIRWLQLTSLMTLIALIGMWIIFALPLSVRGIELDWLAKALIGISVLTLPHTVVVCFMDKIQLRD